jgi:signal transduction histidine kinase
VTTADIAGMRTTVASSLIDSASRTRPTAGADDEGLLRVGLPVGLRLVIDNAIANAAKHGGATEVRLAVASSSEGVAVTVDDNGSGVPEEERTSVFERFSRGSTASRSGSGLGLALVAQQAELHGGTASLGTSPLGGAQLLLQLTGRPS